MAGGGKGGRTTTQVQIPRWLEDATKRTVTRGEQAGQIGYVPWHGPDVAAMTPMQHAAMGNTNAAAQAFGLGTGSGGMPAPTTYAGGVQGYSGMPLYQQGLDTLKAQSPGQWDAIARMFVNPQGRR
jgi:hypothetical protein